MQESLPHPDIEKLHLEVNQIMDQRFWTTAVAISISGVLLGWLVPRATPEAGKAIEPATYFVTISLNLILAALVFLHISLKDYARVLTTYLKLVKASVWEDHWFCYRHEFKRKYVGYNIPQTTIFVLLVLLNTLSPWALSLLYSLKLELNRLMVIHFVSAAFFFIVRWLVPALLSADEKDIEARWSKVLGNSTEKS